MMHAFGGALDSSRRHPDIPFAVFFKSLDVVSVGGQESIDKYKSDGWDLKSVFLNGEEIYDANQMEVL